MRLFKRKPAKPSEVLLIRPYWANQLFSFLPLSIFAFALRPLIHFGSRIDWQIYYWGFLFFTLLAVHGALRPILRITPSQIIFYKTQKRFWFCAWQDVVQVERVKRSLKFTTADGQEMMSPALGNRQRQQVLGIIALHHIPIHS